MQTALPFATLHANAVEHLMIAEALAQIHDLQHRLLEPSVCCSATMASEWSVITFSLSARRSTDSDNHLHAAAKHPIQGDGDDEGGEGHIVGRLDRARRMSQFGTAMIIRNAVSLMIWMT